MDIYKDLYYKLLGEVANLAERAEKIQADAEERYLEACETAYARGMARGSVIRQNADKISHINI